MKKVTLFVDKSVRDLLAKNSECSVSYRASLDFFAKIVAFGSDPRGAWSGIKKDDECEGGFKKFTCGCHGQSDTVRKVFAEAHRLEACLTYFGIKCISLHLTAYRSGEKKPYYKYEFTFDKDGSPATACGSYDNL